VGAQTEIDAAVAQLSAVIQRFRRRRIGIIQYARRLHLGGGNQDPVLCGGNGYRFALQQLIRFGIIRQFKGRIAESCGKRMLTCWLMVVGVSFR
jgi:hypothetical protein